MSNEPDGTRNDGVTILDDGLVITDLATFRREDIGCVYKKRNPNGIAYDVYVLLRFSNTPVLTYESITDDDTIQTIMSKLQPIAFCEEDDTDTEVDDEGEDNDDDGDGDGDSE